MRGLLVNPLIDGLMANGESRMVGGQSPGDKFWRPPLAKSSFGIVTNKVVLEPLSSMGFAVTLIRSFLGFMGQVIPGINRRGVTPKLPRKGAGTSMENRGDFP
jgi:hypothetical protein